VGTTVAMSRAAFDRADTVVIASGWSFPDSVVAGPLAAALRAPVLTSLPAALDDRLVAEIERLGATKAVIVGRPANLSNDVQAALAQRTRLRAGDIRRIAGTDEPSTAVRVAQEVRARTGSPDVLVALGHHPDPSRAWPDALTAGVFGARTGQPVLLVDYERVPNVTLDALRGVRMATIVGGSAAVSAKHAGAIDRVAGDVRRLSGPDRFATAAAVADDLLARRAVDPSRIWAATGSNYADALSAAGALGRVGELFILVDGQGGRGDARNDEWFARHARAINSGRVIGGSAAVSETAVRRLGERLR
jgi:putative cell wall-binding protein